VRDTQVSSQTITQISDIVQLLVSALVCWRLKTDLDDSSCFRRFGGGHSVSDLNHLLCLQEEAFLLYLRSKAVVIGNKKRPDLRGPLPPESGVNELSGEAKLEMRQSGSSNQTSEGWWPLPSVCFPG